MIDTMSKKVDVHFSVWTQNLIEKETLKQKLSAAAAAREDEERKKEKLQHAATKAVP